MLSDMCGENATTWWKAEPALAGSRRMLPTLEVLRDSGHPLSQRCCAQRDSRGYWES